MRAPFRTTIAMIVLLAAPVEARADLGALVADGSAGPYRVSVLAGPVPLRAGPSLWNVLVQDASGNPVDAADVTLSWSTEGHAAHPVERAARPGAHLFYRSAEATLSTATQWHVSTHVNGPEGEGTLAFDVLVSPGLGTWQTYWPALLTPFLALGLFTLHQSLRLRARRSGN